MSMSSFFFQAEDGIRDYKVTGVQTCALPISHAIIERAAGRARSGEAHVLLRHRDRLAELHAQRLRAGARCGAHADAQRRGSAARETGVAWQEDARDVGAIGMDERRLSLE